MKRFQLRIRNYFIVLISLVLLLISFQNCSRVSFKSSIATDNPLTAGTGGGTIVVPDTNNQSDVAADISNSNSAGEVVPVDPSKGDDPIAEVPVVYEEITCQKGAGTTENPWQIFDCACLQEIETNPRRMKKMDSYILMSNLNCAQPAPGTTLFKSIQNFTGSLDGNGFTISNLTIVNGSGAAAIFSGAYGSAKVKNLKLSNIVVSALTQAAALVALNNTNTGLGLDTGTYDNIEVISGTIDAGNGGTAGGILASSYGSISNSINRATVKNTATTATVVGRSGGIAAYWAGAQSSNNRNYGAVTGGWAGGIFGTAHSGSISRNFNYGKVVGVDLVGGLVGAGNARISLSGVKANIEASTSSIGIGQAGGLVGDYTGNIDQSYFIGDLTVKAMTGYMFAGGLASWSRGNDITNSYCFGNINGDGAVEIGGLISNANVNFKLLKDSYFSGNLNLKNSQRYTGGLVAEIYDGQVQNSFADIQSMETSSPYSTLVAGYISDKVISFSNVNYLKIGSYKSTYYAPSVASTKALSVRSDLYDTTKNTALKEWSSSIWKITSGSRPTLQSNPE